MMTSCGMREGEEDGRKEFKTRLQRQREREVKSMIEISLEHVKTSLSQNC